MDIEQIKKDQENGVMICRETFRKLILAAEIMKTSLDTLHQTGAADIVGYVADTLELVEAL